MPTEAYLAAVLATAGALVALDLGERHVTRVRRGSAPLAARSVGFLLAVILVYGALQAAGAALIPDARAMIGTAERLLAEALGPTADAPPLGALEAAAVCVVGFYVAGLWDYLFHRFASHSRWLFFTHEYHHLPTEVFVCAPGIVARPFVVVTALPTAAATVATLALGLAALGRPASALLPLAPIVLLAQFVVVTASHSSFLRRFRIVHVVLSRLGVTSPQEHLLHHATAMNRNFANFATVWDRAFGTYAAPSREDEAELALGLPYDRDFLGAITAGRLRLPESVRARFEVGRYCRLAAGKREDARL